MARIADDEIDRLKREIDLAVLVRGRGIDLRQHGANLVGLCPFHDDREPSLIVTPAKNLWNCLGACQTGGSVVDWVMKSEGVSFRHAIELLRERGGAIGAGRPIEPVKKTSVTKLDSPIALDADDRAALRQLVAYYHDTLKASPAAREYLRKRGIENEEAKVLRPMSSNAPRPLSSSTDSRPTHTPSSRVQKGEQARRRRSHPRDQTSGASGAA